MSRPKIIRTPEEIEVMKEKNRQKALERYYQNREKLNNYWKEYYQKHKEKILAKMKRQYAEKTGKLFEEWIK